MESNVNNEDLVAQVRQRRQYLSECARFISFSYGTQTDEQKELDANQPDSYLIKPEWFDGDKFKHAQHLFKNYKVLFFLSHAYGLALSVYHRDELIPLISTGKSLTIGRLFQRYLSTIVHVNNWYLYDPFETGSPAEQSLRMVRQFHSQVANKLNDARSDLHEADGTQWISQQRMSNGQFSFVGLMAIFPKQLGFKTFNKKDFSAIFHFWRTIGYCLGIEDRFNLCNGTDEETIEMCRQIYNEELHPIIIQAMSNSSPLGEISIRMSKGLFLVLTRLDFHLNYNAMMRYASEFLMIPSPELNTVKELYLYKFITYSYKFGSYIKPFHWAAAKWFDFRLKQALKYQNQFIRHLQKKYPEQLYNPDNVQIIKNCCHNRNSGRHSPLI